MAIDDKAEGGWEGSGGDGVACWQSEEEANEAEKQLLDPKVGHLDQKTKETIVSLEVLDYWEKKKKTGLDSLEQYNLLKAEVHKRVNQELKLSVPLFFRLYKRVHKPIGSAYWQAKANVSQVNDTTPKSLESSSLRDSKFDEVKSKSPNCRLVQLAVRYQKKHEKGRVPDYWIEYDKYLVEEKLNGFQQAVLEIHESLYLVGADIGQKSSHRVRPAVTNILVAGFSWVSRKRAPIKFAFRLSSTIFQSFSEYHRVFAKESDLNPPHPEIGEYNQYSRLLSFNSLLDQARPHLKKCVQETKRLSIQCWERSIHRLSMHSMSDEEAFMYLAWFKYFIFEQKILATHLMDWSPKAPYAVTEKQQELLKSTCAQIDALPMQHLTWMFQKKQAQRYCKEIFESSTLTK